MLIFQKVRSEQLIMLGQKQELSEEISDLIYHVFVLMSANEVPLAAVVDQLSQRRDSGK